MGKFVLVDASTEIDGTDLSKRASQVTVEMPTDEVDVSAMQSEMKETERGLRDASMTFNFFQDFAASQTDSVLWPLNESGEKFIVIVKPFSGPVSATNPAYIMGGKLYNYTPIAGGVGEASTTETPIKNATDLGIKKAEDEKEGEEAGEKSVETIVEEIEALFV
jgi:hypothetical protein